MPPLVLAYHAVAEEPFDGMAAEMVVLADALEEEVTRLRALGREFRLTFDDGWADALTVAAPLLRSLDVGATFFVCPGLFGNTEDSGYSPLHRVLTREEAGELASLGFDLGAHSMTHPDLVGCDDAELRAQLHDSKAEVEAITGRPCTEFAYPFGLHDARVRAATAAAGFTIAYQYGPGPWDDPFAAPRIPKPAY
jgi:peptidoglycan/xylan/chitin deacetylase (PgdA/CDA1 family)